MRFRFFFSSPSPLLNHKKSYSNSRTQLDLVKRSSAPGIVCERFCCGPPAVCEPCERPAPEPWRMEDFYTSEYGILTLTLCWKWQFFPEHVGNEEIRTIRGNMIPVSFFILLSSFCPNPFANFAKDKYSSPRTYGPATPSARSCGLLCLKHFNVSNASQKRSSCYSYLLVLDPDLVAGGRLKHAEAI